MTELILLSQADLDIQSAFARYEDYQTGRGEIFMHQLDAAFTLLREHPEMAPVYSGAYRRLLLKDFPFGIFYQVQPKRLLVAAILDLRQDPTTLRRRLFGSDPENPPNTGR